MYDIVTLGSATVDLFADTDSEVVQIETRQTVERLIAYPLGSKILINELNTTIGGGGTNTAVAFARLGLKTAFLGKVGNDAQGDQVMAALLGENVAFVGARGGQTGVSMILDSIHEDRTILAFKGANNDLHREEIQLPRCRWLYCSAMLGASLETLTGLVAEVEAKVAFNPSNYLARQGAQALQPILRHLSVLVLNREESCLLLGLDTRSHGALPELMRIMLEQLHIPVIALTDGAQGVAVSDGNILVTAKPREDLNIRETTGAGDAFASGLVAMLCQGQSLEVAVRCGMLNAESVLAFKGAKNHLLSAQELAEQLSSDQRLLHSEPL